MSEQGVKLHGFTVYPETGEVYGPRGRLVKRMANGYIQPARGRRCWGAHRLVWEAVNGPIEGSMEINHKNGVKTDNRIENLELLTRSGNMTHAYRTGLISRVGSKNGRAKLTEADVIEIRRRRADGETAVSLAEEYGVSPVTISHNSIGRRWSALKEGAAA